MPELSVYIDPHCKMAATDWICAQQQQIREAAAGFVGYPRREVLVYYIVPQGGGNMHPVEVRLEGEWKAYYEVDQPRRDDFLCCLAATIPEGWHFGVWFRPNLRGHPYVGEYEDGAPLIGTGQDFGPQPPPDEPDEC